MLLVGASSFIPFFITPLDKLTFMLFTTILLMKPLIQLSIMYIFLGLLFIRDFCHQLQHYAASDCFCTVGIC